MTPGTVLTAASSGRVTCASVVSMRDIAGIGRDGDARDVKLRKNGDRQMHRKVAAQRAEQQRERQDGFAVRPKESGKFHFAASPPAATVTFVPSGSP